MSGLDMIDRSDPICGALNQDGVRCARNIDHHGDHGSATGVRWPAEGPITRRNGDEPQYTDDPEYDGPLPRDGRVAG